MRRTRDAIWLSAASSIVLGGMLLASPSFAAAQSSSGNQHARDHIEQVTVTARRRVEDIQKVPIAVTAITSQTISDNAITTTAGLEKLVPNVNLTPINYAGGALGAAIRGVSFDDLERSFEPAIAVSVDGMFLASNSGALVDMFDIGSIEVLRGPQGTLFGRNTVGGVINVTHTRPTGEWGATADLTFGSNGEKDYKFRVNMPIVRDKLAAKFTFYSLNSDSFQHNLFTGKTDPGIDRKAASATFLFTPNENFDALLTYTHIDDHSHYPKPVNLTAPGQLFCAAFGACITNGADLQARHGYDVSLTGGEFYTPYKSDSVILQMNDRLGAVTLHSISGYMHMTDTLNEENTGAADISTPVGPMPLLRVYRGTHSWQFTQELRAETNFSGPFNMVGGIYYFHSYYRLYPQSVYLLGGEISRFTATQKDDSLAAFAEGTYQITPDTQLTVGGRYTWESKDFTMTTYATPPATGVLFKCPDPSLVGPAYAACRKPTTSYTKFTPHVSLSHNLSKDIMIYASYSQGFRSGGWNGRAASTTSIGPYAPETVDSYEVGWRSEFFQKRLQLNLTAFRADYNNKQEEVLTPSPINPAASETTVQNAGQATINGLEVEAEAIPVDGLHLTGSLGYLDASYQKFLVSGVDVRASKNFRYAPKWTFDIGGDYTIPAGSMGGAFILVANYNWSDKFTTSPNKDTTGLGRDTVPSYGKLDLSIGYTGDLTGPNVSYRLSLFANDVLHSDGHITRKLDAGAFWFGAVQPGRTIGVQLTLQR